MNQQQPSEELGNVHPEELGLEMPTGPGTEEVDAKDSMVLGYWREAMDAEFTVQGLDYNQDPTIDNLSARFDRIKLDAVIMRRRTLESNSLFRHPIPYALIHRYNEEKNRMEFFVYHRTKKVGEEKLAGNHSISVGGHPEAQSMRFYPNCTLNAKEALLSCLVDELDEELTFNGMTFQELVERTAITFSQEGFIRDDVNEVGKQHLGVVYSIGLPPHVDVQCLEEELVTVGFRTLEEIIDPTSGFNLERWSYILADNLIRMAQAERAKIEAEAESDATIAAEARAQADAISQLPPAPLTVEKANEYQESSGFDLLEWDLAEGESLSIRGDQVFYDGFIDHPMEGKKEIIVGIDPNDPDPVATVAAIKDEVLKGWDILKGDSVPVPEDGNGRGLTQPIELNPELQLATATVHERDND